MLSSRKAGVSCTAQKIVLMFCVFVIGVSVLPDVAAAHSDLAASTPQDGATVLVEVSEIELVFANPIDFDKSSFVLIDEVGEAVLIESVSIADDRVTVTILIVPPIHQGVVGVGYTIVSSDSHPRSGSITFAVSAPTPTATPNPTSTPTPTPAVQLATPLPTPPPVEEAAPTTTAEPTTSLVGPVPVASEEPTPPPASLAAPPATLDDAEVKPAPLPDLSAFLAPSPSLGRMIDAQTVVRGIGYGAGVLLIGGFLFFAKIAATSPAGIRRQVLQIAALATVLCGVALVALQAGIGNAGEVSALVNPGELASVLRGNFAIGVLLRLVGGLVALASLGSSAVAVVPAGLTALSFPFLGHGVSRDPAWLVFPADLVHVVVVAVWTGGLLMLVLELRRRRPTSLASAANPPTHLVERFSTVAGIAVAAAAITGVALAATELQSFGELLSTSYGKRLVLKTILVAGIISLGAIHRFRLIPALRRDGSDSTSLRKMVVTGAIEVTIMAGVVVVTTLMVSAAG